MSGQISSTPIAHRATRLCIRIIIYTLPNPGREQPVLLSPLSRAAPVKEAVFQGSELGPVIPSVSPARLAANRANAQLSTGPISESGKTKSSKNALKTALTGRTVLLPQDDADRYERHLDHYQKAYQPIGERELELVQSLADTTWRLDRIPGLEEALYFKGSNEFAAQVAELGPRQTHRRNQAIDLC